MFNNLSQTLGLETLQKSLNEEVENARLWMLANKLTINTTKSNDLVISYVTSKRSSNVAINCGGLSIATQTNMDLIIDNKLSFEKYIKFVGRKLACAVGIMGKRKHCFPKETLLQLYHALVYLHSSYALPGWGSTYESNL